MALKTHSITKRQRKIKYSRIHDVYRTCTERTYIYFIHAKNSVHNMIKLKT